MPAAPSAFAVALTAPDANRADDSEIPEPTPARPAGRTPDADPGAAPAPPPGAPAPAGEPGPPACAAAGDADAGPPDDNPLPDEAGEPPDDAGDDDIDRGIICPIIDDGDPADEAGEPPDDGADDTGGDECAGDGNGFSGFVVVAAAGSIFAELRASSDFIVWSVLPLLVVGCNFSDDRSVVFSAPSFMVV